MKQTCSVICVLISVATNLFTIATANAREGMRVDGVPVYGNVHTVERIDLRNAIKLGEGRGGVSKLEVLGRADIKVYLRPSDRGYILAGRFAGVNYDGTRSHDWSFSGPFMYDRDVSDFVRHAQEVYVFPVANPLKPHRDPKRMRLLSGEARREIVQLIGNQKSWFQGHWDAVFVGPDRRNVGLLFRDRADELILFFDSSGFAEGSIKGQFIGDGFEGKQREQFEKWTQRYAQAELTVK